MPRLELGVILRVGDVPVVLGSFSDPRVVRGALQGAIESAPDDSGIAGRQELAILHEFLRQVGESPAAASYPM